VEGVRTY